MKRCAYCKRVFIPSEHDTDFGGFMLCGAYCIQKYFSPKFNLQKFREEQGGEYGTNMEKKRGRGAKN